MLFFVCLCVNGLFENMDKNRLFQRESVSIGLEITFYGISWFGGFWLFLATFG
jgi:hypothetical protein